MPITVRKLTPEDAEAYRVCRLDALRDAPTSFTSSYEEEESMTIEMIWERFADHASGSAVFGAFDGEKMIGLTGMFRESKRKRSHKMDMVSVFVYPEYRGKKVGHALVEAAIAHARSVDGVERIELGVRADNAFANALYLAFGFTTWGVEPDFILHDGNRYEENHMTLKL